MKRQTFVSQSSSDQEFREHRIIRGREISTHNIVDSNDVVEEPTTAYQFRASRRIANSHFTARAIKLTTQIANAPAISAAIGETIARPIGTGTTTVYAKTATIASATDNRPFKDRR